MFINKKHPDPDSKLFANLLTTGGFRGFPQHEDWWLNFPYLPSQLCELSCVWHLFWQNQRDRRTGCLDVFYAYSLHCAFPLCTTNKRHQSLYSPDLALENTARPSFYFLSYLPSENEQSRPKYSISRLISAALDVRWFFGREPQLLPAGGPSWHQEQPRGAQGKVTIKNGAGCPETRAVSRSTLIHKSLQGKLSLFGKKQTKKNTLPTKDNKTSVYFNANCGVSVHLFSTHQ